jgi:hypothetical protein
VDQVPSGRPYRRRERGSQRPRRATGERSGLQRP